MMWQACSRRTAAPRFKLKSRQAGFLTGLAKSHSDEALVAGEPGVRGVPVLAPSEGRGLFKP
jgi:hypothetical protein